MGGYSTSDVPVVSPSAIQPPPRTGSQYSGGGSDDDGFGGGGGGKGKGKGGGGAGNVFGGFFGPGNLFNRLRLLLLFGSWTYFLYLISSSVLKIIRAGVLGVGSLASRQVNDKSEDRIETNDEGKNLEVQVEAYEATGSIGEDIDVDLTSQSKYAQFLDRFYNSRTGNGRGEELFASSSIIFVCTIGAVLFFTLGL